MSTTTHILRVPGKGRCCVRISGRGKDFVARIESEFEVRKLPPGKRRKFDKWFENLFAPYAEELKSVSESGQVLLWP